MWMTRIASICTYCYLHMDAFCFVIESIRHCIVANNAKTYTKTLAFQLANKH